MDFYLLHFSREIANILFDLCQLLDVRRLLLDLVLYLLEVIEYCLGLESSPLGYHVDEVLLKSLVLLQQRLLHLLAVNLKKGHLNLLRKRRSQIVLFLNNLSYLGLNLLNLPGGFFHLNVPCELVRV